MPSWPSRRSLEAFGVLGATLQTTKARDTLSELEVHPVLGFHPPGLAFTAGQQLPFQFKSLADSHRGSLPLLLFEVHSVSVKTRR